MRIRLNLDTKFVPAVDTTTNGGSCKRIANYGVLSMGRGMKHFEGEIGTDGILRVDWNLEPLGTQGAAGPSGYRTYENQIGSKQVSTPEMVKNGINYNDAGSAKLQSHFLISLYHKYDLPKRQIGRAHV